MSAYLGRVAILLSIGVCACLPSSACAQDTTDKKPLHVSLPDAEETPEGDKDWDSLLALRSGKKLDYRRNFGYMLTHLGKEWPRLLTTYVQPAVRGLVADQQGSNSLSFKSTLFRNDTRGMQLSGGVGRNFWGEREARLHFSMRF